MILSYAQEQGYDTVRFRSSDKKVSDCNSHSRQLWLDALHLLCLLYLRVGKIKPLKLIQKTVRFQNILCKLRDVWLITDDFVIDLEEFTIMCHLWKKPL